VTVPVNHGHPVSSPMFPTDLTVPQYRHFLATLHCHAILPPSSINTITDLSRPEEIHARVPAVLNILYVPELSDESCLDSLRRQNTRAKGCLGVTALVAHRSLSIMSLHLARRCA